MELQYEKVHISFYKDCIFKLNFGFQFDQKLAKLRSHKQDSTKRFPLKKSGTKVVVDKELFKKYLRKIGSGQHTSRGLSQKEAAEALKLILTGKATPAQIGAFMIAHRIRRPEPQELAGMLKTYQELGPKLSSRNGQRRPICFGMPFDGRDRTLPIYPLTTLILLSANQPVVLQGGQRMPIKFGIPTIELFNELGLQLKGISIQKVQTCFQEQGFAFIYQPDHFPLADKLISYREEIGKRSTIASMELIWTAHQGDHLLVSGFVHPPTEKRAFKALQLIGERELLSIKGLEGGTDLPINRACITGLVNNHQLERIILNPHDYKCSGEDKKLCNLKDWRKYALQAIENKGPLKEALKWNSGAYLWFAGITKSLEEGINKAEECMASGSAKIILKQLISWREKIST